MLIGLLVIKSGNQLFLTEAIVPSLFLWYKGSTMENKNKRLSIIYAALIICAVCLLILCSKPGHQAEESRPVDIETLKSRLILQTEEDPYSNTRISRGTFAEAVRTMMYYRPYNRRIPYLIHRAFEGDFEPFAQLGTESNRGIRRLLALGMLLSVTCAEDLARITEEEIIEVTGGTFLRDNRVRQQKAVCEFWPKSELPDNYGDPVSVDVPVLLLSGTLDPMTPPRWGEKAASHLPQSLHLVVPGVHGVGGECIRTIQQQFLETGSVKDLDISCVESMKMPPFRIPK